MTPPAKHYRYRGYLIDYDPPPIPTRAHDWQWAHADFDGAPDEVGGPPADHRHGSSATLADAQREIDEQIAEDEGEA